MNASPESVSSPSGSVCPSCQRFVGAYDNCPYCGTGLKKRVPLKILRYSSLIIALAGMVCLHLMAFYRDIPSKPIGDISPAMNMGYISVQGHVSQPLRFYRDGDSLTGLGFSLEDDTGDLRVRAYRQVAAALNNEGLSLRRGDLVKVSGSVRITEGDSVSLLLQNPQHIEVLSATDVRPVSLADLADVEDGENVKLAALVSRIYFPSSERAPYRIAVKDETGSSELVIWGTQFDQIADREKLVEGTRIEVQASKGAYRGKPQLQIENAADLVVLAQAGGSDAAATVIPTAKSTPVVNPVATAEKPNSASKLSAEQSAAPGQNAITPLSAIAALEDGVRVIITGVVVVVQKPHEGTQAPYTIFLQAPGQPFPVVCWEQTWQHIPEDQKPHPGSPVRVAGPINSFKGQKQLKLMHSKDYVLQTAGTNAAALPVASPAAPAAATPAAGQKTQAATKDSPAAVSTGTSLVSLKDAQALPDGSSICAAGTVTSITSPFSERSPYTVTITDGTVSMPVVLWQKTWDALPQKPSTGMPVRVSGTINTYRGVNQIRLSSAADFTRSSE